MNQLSNNIFYALVYVLRAEIPSSTLQYIVYFDFEKYFAML